MPDWESQMIEQMRANGGNVIAGPLAGHPLLIVMMVGAKSGEPRRAILTYTRDGDDYVVAGSKGGAPTDPAWLSNLRANPDVTIEAGNRTFQARALRRDWSASGRAPSTTVCGMRTSRRCRISPTTRRRQVGSSRSSSSRLGRLDHYRGSVSDVLPELDPMALRVEQPDE